MFFIWPFFTGSPFTQLLILHFSHPKYGILTWMQLTS